MKRVTSLPCLNSFQHLSLPLTPSCSVPLAHAVPVELPSSATVFLSLSTAPSGEKRTGQYRGDSPWVSMGEPIEAHRLVNRAADTPAKRRRGETAPLRPFAERFARVDVILGWPIAVGRLPDLHLTSLHWLIDIHALVHSYYCTQYLHTYLHTSSIPTFG